MSLPFDAYNQIIYQFNGKQLLKDTQYYLDITTSDTLVISPKTIAVKIANGTKEITESYLSDSIGLIKKGDLFSWTFFLLPDSIDYIQTISTVFNLTDILDLKLDYCFTIPKSNKFRSDNTITSISLCEGTSSLGNGPWCPDDYELWDFWELSKTRVCLEPPDFNFENERAWYYTTGNPDIIVALVDRGLDMEDEDFLHNDLGYNFIDNNQNVSPDVHDDVEMGTAHASIIGAKTSSKYGLAGVAGGDYSDTQNPIHGTTLMVLKASEDNYTLNGIAAAQSIVHAVNNNARIINFPWYSESEENFEIVAEALDYANLNDVIVFAPTGDAWGVIGNEVWWPAKRVDVVAVGATDKDNNRAEWYNPGYICSRYGNETEISLPGDFVLVRDIYFEGFPGHPAGYSEVSTTSIATSMASGIAALMLTVNPCLKPQEIRSLLIESCVQVGGYNYFHSEEKPGHSLELGYGLIEAYEAVKAVVNYPADHIITQNEVWTGSLIKGNIIVKSGTTLTLNNVYLEMYPGKKIIIEPEGKLYVNGGTITNNCGEPWQGIEVWGNSTASQATINGGKAQGWLVLENEAVIENAIAAVELWKPGDLSKTGGIVQATKAHFVNNRNSVHANEYRNFNPYIPEREMDNVSYFTDCEFDLNEDYIPTQTFYKHVDLYKVKGIKFSGCDFSLTTVAGVSEWSSAIASNSAGFTVSAICTSNTNPCSEWDKCTFNGFNSAIHATRTYSNNYTFTVIRADFTDNIYGVQVEGVNNFSVLFSDFFIGHNAVDEEECEGLDLYAAGYGISSSNATGFAIEENYFTKSQGAPAGKYVGIYIAETQATDQVYKNTFEGLSYGNYALGKNWLGINTWQGLAYYCNENTGNWEDFTVEDDPNHPDGIQDPQGSTLMPAGNTFSANANYNFNNWDFNDWIGYYYYAPSPGNINTVYYPSEVNRVTRNEVVGIQNQCLSHHGGGSTEGGLVMTPEEKQQAELDFAANLADYNNVKSLYDNLKDGGNTDATLTYIETAWPQDMWELRAELLGKSPHLSMEVLKTVADKNDVLPESVIFEIMAANPDELKKEELIKYLEDKENPLPDYMVDILRQVAMGSTYKTVLIRQMAHYNQVKTLAAYDIIRSLLNDSLVDNSELRNWLDNVGGKRADEQIIATYLSEGNYTDAMALANMMPVLYKYSGDEIIEHTYYTEMLNLQISLANKLMTIFDLDSTEVSNLVFIADNSIGTAGAQAKGILEFAYGYHYCNCIGVDTSDYKNSNAFDPDAFEKLYGIEISVEPNPVREWAAFNYTLPDNNSECVIKISDVSGKQIATLPINRKQGQTVWDTRKVKSGVYFYTLNVSGFRKSGKIVVSK